MANIKKFHPGVYIKDALETLDMTAKEFSFRTGISERTLSSIINGNGDLTFEVSYKLAEFFDNSVNFWTNLQNQYNLYLKKEEEKQSIENDWILLKNIKQYLLEYNYIDVSDDKVKIVYKIRKLVGVNRLELLDKQDLMISLKEQKSVNKSNLFLQNFWIALALKESRKRDITSYNKEKLKSSLNEIRALSTMSPEDFMPRLREIFDDCGINFVFLPYLSKSNIYGVTKWFNSESVMIAVSNRGERADVFWFTIFHELSHVLMEHKRKALISIDGIDDVEADKKAADMLIPFEKWKNFIDKNEFNENTIKAFARKIGILPALVLGRLHKENKEIPYGILDKKFNIYYKDII